MAETKTVKCKQCSKEFVIPVKRGRPPLKCEKCRGVKWTGPAEIVESPTKITTPNVRPVGKNKVNRYSPAMLVAAIEEGKVDPHNSKAVVEFIHSITGA